MSNTSPFASRPRRVDLAQLDTFVSQARMPELPGPSKSMASNDFANANHS